jgi:protein phosphatase
VIVRKRLARGKLTVIDATNVQPEARKTLIELAREYHVFAVAIVFDLPERLCQDRNASRADRQFGPHVVRNQLQQLRKSLRGLEREGIRCPSSPAGPRRPLTRPIGSISTRRATVQSSAVASG